MLLLRYSRFCLFALKLRSQFILNDADRYHSVKFPARRNTDAGNQGFKVLKIFALFFIPDTRDSVAFLSIWKTTSFGKSKHASSWRSLLPTKLALFHGLSVHVLHSFCNESYRHSPELYNAFILDPNQTFSFCTSWCLHISLRWWCLAMLWRALNACNNSFLFKFPNVNEILNLLYNPWAVFWNGSR